MIKANQKFKQKYIALLLSILPLSVFAGENIELEKFSNIHSEHVPAMHGLKDTNIPFSRFYVVSWDRVNTLAFRRRL